MNDADLSEPEREAQSTCWRCVAGAAALVVSIGLADRYTPPAVNCATLYLLPILLATWCVGRWMGLLTAGAAVAAWLLADMGRLPADHTWTLLAWNIGMRLATYMVVVVVMAALKEARDRQSDLARTDSLTGIANARAFYEEAAKELERARRYKRPFTLAFIDVDHFKTVNDEFGHSEGDALLRRLAAVISHNVRTTDTVARVGGDEFVVLFPETEPEPAHELLQRINARLVDSLDGHGANVTLSIGAATFRGFPACVDDVIKRADTLMYEAKRSGRNRVEQSVFDG